MEGSAIANQTRRRLLASTAAIGFATAVGRPAGARVISGALPWAPNQVYPPEIVRPGPWRFFTAEEAAAVEAIADRLIPPDELGAGGKDAGCAVFIDRQLMGPYGTNEWLYMEAPFVPDAPSNFGPQSPLTPRQRYREGLTELAGYTKQAFGGKLFHQLDVSDQDAVLTGIEKGDLKIANGRAFFSQLQANVVEGFFADPLYGGNKDMVAGESHMALLGDGGACGAVADWIPRVGFSEGPSSWKSSSRALPMSLIRGRIMLGTICMNCC